MGRFSSNRSGKRFNSGIQGGVEFYKDLLRDADKYVGEQGSTVRYFQITPDGISAVPGDGHRPPGKEGSLIDEGKVSINGHAKGYASKKDGRWRWLRNTGQIEEFADLAALRKRVATVYKVKATDVTIG